MRTAHSKQEPKSSGSPYDGQRLRKNRIRLLTIHSSGDIIELRTQRYRISGNVDYDAISYVWGTATASVTAMCNNKRLLITPTVWKMLQNLYGYQTKTVRRKIWIDAICINQDDDEEKRTQIPLMRDIYSRAGSVIVWMGSPTPETKVFFAEFQDVRQKSRNWIAHRTDDPTYRNPIEEELPCYVYAFFEGLSPLLNNEWFRRLWTYQEIILPIEATLLCGESWTDFDEFLDFIMDGVFHTDYIFSNWSSKTQSKSSIAVQTCQAIDFHRKTASQREWTNELHSKNVAADLYGLRSRHVKEPVDRVWAIVGLLQSDLRDKVISEIDYNEQGRIQYWKTWIMFAKALINERYGMTLLNIPPTLEPRPSLLPSWCPNLSGTSACRMFFDGRWNLPIDQLLAAVTHWALSEENSEVNSAERFKAIDDHDRRCFSTVNHDDLLRVRGFVLDALEDVVDYEKIPSMGHDDDEDPKEPVILHDLAVNHHMNSLDLARRVYYGKVEGVTDIPEDFITALFLDDRITEKARNAYHELLPKMRNWHREVWADDTWEQKQCMRHFAFTGGQTFFSTMSGRIGYAPSGCKPGDQVATFYGGQPLYILRQLIPTKDDIGSTGQAYGHVQYMGAAFIPQLMKQHERDAARIGPDTMFMIH